MADLLQTDLSRKPYFDDFDETKNYYRVLYKPATAVQVRELNQMQTTLQDQITKFGRNVFKEGSVVEGCQFTFDNNYNYVQINDNFSNGFAISTVTAFANSIITNANGLKSVVVNTVGGFQSQAPNLNTLYIKYLNSGTYPNGQVQLTYSNNETLTITSTSNVVIGNVVVATPANSSYSSTGKGYAFTTTQGVIYKKGFFIDVNPQTLIVDKYSNIPDGLSVGFEAVENIITSETDNSLLDNAAGAPNYAAPGADRLQLIPTLVTRLTSDISNTSSFFSLCDFKNGLPVTIKNDPQYSALGKQEAQRTYETNGDFVVNPFLLSVANKSANDSLSTSYLNLVSSAGLGYVKGYRVQFINNNYVNLRKGLDTESISNQVVTMNYGYYIQINEYCGDFDNDKISQFELHSISKKAISNKTFLSTGYSSATKIGTAYCRAVSYQTGTPGVDATYNLYMFNVQMLPGHSFSDVRSIIQENSGSIIGVADVVLTYNTTLSSNVAQIQQTTNKIAIYPFGQNALLANGFSSTSYVYRRKSTGSFQANGSLSISLPAVSGSANEQFYYTGTLDSVEESTYIIIPTVTGYSTNKSGNVTVVASNSVVTGTSTAFLTDYSVGDYIYSNSETHRILTIANNTYLTTVDNWQSSATSTHQKTFPAGVPINFQSNLNRGIVATQTASTLNLNESISSAFQTSVYYDVWRSNTVSVKKNINKYTYVKIDTSTHPNGVNGPWSLGIPDVFQVRNVYVGSNGSYSNSNPDNRTSFQFNNGQGDVHYGLASLTPLSPVANGTTLLVCLDNFTQDTSQGKGFFTAASYPIDDVNTANSTAIQTAQIPQYVSVSLGTTSDLRNCIDFRPYTTNTAVANATVTSATINPSSTEVLAVDTNGSYLATPDSGFITSLVHYLPRIDRVALTTGGDIIVTEGVSSVHPVAPNEVAGTMTIGIVGVPAYPSLTPTDAKSYNRYDYSVTTTIQQTKRYTMADIGKLDKRITNLEYYTSLSLTEQATNNLNVTSGKTGQNRFKNGILVDPFQDHTIGNTNNPAYRVAIDSANSEARPFFNQILNRLRFDSSVSSGVVQTGDLITLSFNEGVFQNQNYATKYRNCIEGNIYTYRGSMKLDPAGTTEPDLTRGPDVTSSLDLSQNWVNLQKYLSAAWGTAWSSWSDVGSASVVSSSTSTTLTNSVPNADGTLTNSYQSQTTTTTAQQVQRTGTNLTVTNSSTSVDLGSYVTDVSILPYLKSTPFMFTVHGMKPNTKLYAYFNSVPVSNYCYDLTPYSGSITYQNGYAISANGKYVYTDSSNNNYEYVGPGTNITADANGSVYGVFVIPDNTFQSGDLEFKLTDISDLTQGEDAVTTQATATYAGSSLSVQKSEAILQVREPVVATQEVTQQSTLYQTTTSSASYTQVVGNPSPYIGNYGYNSAWWNNSGGHDGGEGNIGGGGSAGSQSAGSDW